MRNEVKTHEITTWSGRGYPLTEQEAAAIRERMEAGAKFLTIPNGTPWPDTVALNDIKGLSKRQLTMADMHKESKALPEGEKKEFDPLAPGYIKFLVGSIRLRMKFGGGVSKITNKLTEQQKKLVFEEMKKQGLVDENNNLRTNAQPEK